MPAPNHYEVLGLANTVDQSDIEARYAELLRLYGADGSHGNMGGLIEEAYRILGNPSLRAVYDSGLGLSTVPPPPPPAPLAPIISEAPPPLEKTIGMAPPKGYEPTVIERPADVPVQIGSPKNSEPPTTAVPDNKTIASELARRGISPDEVAKLMAIGKPNQISARGKKKPALDNTPMVPPSVAYEPKPTITLPTFRPSTIQEQQDAEKFLTSANIARRRGQFAQAEKECRSALDKIPSDGSVLEMYGDIMQSLGRVDNALYAYQRAIEADPKRKGAEKKYAELMLLQNREIDLLRVESIPRNVNLAMLMGIVPGAGQFYNGDTLKGVALGIITAMCGYLTFFSPYGLPNHKGSMPMSLIFIFAVYAVCVIIAIFDGVASAKRGKIPKSGWEI